ncbi:MAG: acyl carrier protein [Elusimicrobia bacterium]|nr:acyl carrier protein [Elusimicrobiota bacterium]
MGDKIRQVFVTEFGIKPDVLKPESRLYADLGLDSIDAIDLVVRLEMETGLKLNIMELKSIRTLQDVIDIVTRRLRDKK